MDNLKKVYYGYVQAKCDPKLYVNTLNDEPVDLHVSDDDTRNALYCESVRITVETISREELILERDKIIKGNNNEG